MLVTLSIPEESVGDVIGDLNSRRGRPAGMDSVGGGLTEVKAEVPMSGMFAYALPGCSLTGSRATTRWSSTATRRCPRTCSRRSSRRRPPEEAVSA